VIAYEM